MKARHLCATVGMALAVGAVLFVQSLVATNDAQSGRMAARLLKALPIEKGAKIGRFEVDFRPDGRVLQGPPMMAAIATQAGVNGALVTKAFFAQRHVRELPPVGEELTLIGRKGAYRVRIGGYLDWERPVRGYPNILVSPETAAAIDEDWQPYAAPTVSELAPAFMSDAGRNMDRAKPLLLWAAALTALCLLLNSLFLTIESRRHEIAILRMIGLTRGGVVRLVLREAVLLAFAGLVLGTAGAVAALLLYISLDPATFPAGAAISWRGLALTAVAAPFVALLGALLALRPALAVRPLEAASAHAPRRRTYGMIVAVACGFGAFVAVEVWGTSLTKPFVPSPEWPDAIVSILPRGVSSFDIARLRKLPGVRRIAELQPLQVNLDPLEKLKGFGGGGGPRGPRKAYRNALLLASDWLPDFRFTAGSHDAAAAAIAAGDACVITEMMARARKLSLGDRLSLDAGDGLKVALKVVGIVDLNWHMVTSRALVRGLNRMPVNTDGPVFVSFDTLAVCDRRPQELVRMTHLWLDYEPAFVSGRGTFPAGCAVERSLVEALDGAWDADAGGAVRGNAVRLHARDEIADGTLAHGTELVGAMARVPFVFLAVIALGFVALLVSTVEARRRTFFVLRTVGATRGQLAGALVAEALRTALAGILIGFPGGALVGWLCTAATRAAMSNWGLPAAFDIPLLLCLEGALGALLFVLAVAIPTALALPDVRVSRREFRYVV